MSYKFLAVIFAVCISASSGPANTRDLALPSLPVAEGKAVPVQPTIAEKRLRAAQAAEARAVLAAAENARRAREA